MKQVLIIVDIQNDFAHPAGALYVKGGEKVALAIEQLVKEKVNDYSRIIATADWHPENHYSFKENGGQWSKHCVQDTWGAGLLLSGWTREKIHSLIVKGTDPDNKNDYSGFGGYDIQYAIHMTLQEILDVKENKEVDIIGVALDYCVKATAIDAAKLGYKTRVLLKYTAAVNLKPGDDEKAIKEMEKEGVEIIE